MAQHVFRRETGALRETDEDDPSRRDAAMFARLIDGPIALVDRPGQKRFVGVDGLHEAMRVPASGWCRRSHPATAVDTQAIRQTYHFLGRAPAAVQQHARQGPAGLDRHRFAPRTWGPPLGGPSFVTDLRR